VAEGLIGRQRSSRQREPAAQRLGRLRVGQQRRQILRPQLEKAARQLVGLVHPRHYTRAARALHGPAQAFRFDEANRKIRCIVAAQQFVFCGTSLA